MLRPLRLLNLLLGLAAMLMAAALIKPWVAPGGSPVSSPAVTKPPHDAEALAYNPTIRPPIDQFNVLLDKNPFKQPPPMPARSSAVTPPVPLPALVGTILVDHERRAILSDKGKSNIYSVGQGVAGGTIAEIKADRITFKRGDTTQEIMLKAAIESVAAAPAQAGAPAAPAPLPRPSQPPDAIPGIENQPGAPPVGWGGVTPEERNSRREEMKRRVQEKREQIRALQQDRQRP